MTVFRIIAGSRLYVADPDGVGDDCGWAGALVPPGQGEPPPMLTVAQALNSTESAPAGISFVLSADPPKLAGAGLTAFIAQLDRLFPSNRRFIAWLTDVGKITAETARLMNIAYDGSSSNGFQGQIVPSALALTITNGAAIAPTDASLRFTVRRGAAAQLYGPSPPQQIGTLEATVALSGPLRGCVQFQLYLQRRSLNDVLGWGFQALAPSPEGRLLPAYGAWLALASGEAPAASDYLGFNASIDPADPFGAQLPNRSLLAFSGQNFDRSATVLYASFTTTSGIPLELVPIAGTISSDPNVGRLVFNMGVPGANGQALFQLAPAGDFVLGLPGKAPVGATGREGNAPGATDDPPPSASRRLLCGLQGTESIGFQAGADRLRFVSGQPAYASRFPFPIASPVAAPVDPTAPLLDGTYTTSWASFVSGGGGAGSFVGQPAGASLYGADELIHPAYPALYGAREFPTPLAQTAVFPLFPYGGAQVGDGVSGFDRAALQSFEEAVVGPTRRACVGPPTPRARTPRVRDTVTGTGTGGATDTDTGEDTRTAAGDSQTTPSAYNGTTPSGLLVAAEEQSGAYEKLLLALDSGGTEMSFAQLDPLLQQAFQTAQLFLVVANAKLLGEFASSVSLGGWKLTANVGQGDYGDYANVMIVKGRPGVLYDPRTPDANLLARPQTWVQAKEFAAPGHTNDPAPHPEELVALSAWLQSYFQAAHDDPDQDYFGPFNQIATRASWTGILVLRVSLQPPSDLAGIGAGVTAPERFCAHHLCIQISPVQNPTAGGGKGTIELSAPSSMAGLIYYQDPEFVPPPRGQPVQPVLPQSGVQYDFRLLLLKALFANSAVQGFQSYAQLTVNELFGMPVTAMTGEDANALNTLVLDGAYQDNGGVPVYSLATSADTTFSFANNVLQRIELIGAQMTTRSAGDLAHGEPVISAFSLQGYLDFAAVSATKGGPFDVLSFGNAHGSQLPRQGLSFAELDVLMSYWGKPASKQMSFDASGIRFDVATSTPRSGSLFLQFALQLEGLVQGSADAAPAASGYLPVIGDAIFSGVDGSPWYGLRYGLDLGTPGALAGDIGLKSTLIVAWAPTSSGSSGYQAFLGLELPGTGGGARLISLQNVLRLSIGQLKLTFTDKGAFLLMLTDIALRFLGLLKIPPSGSTLFYLFGNPESAGEPSGLGWYAMYDNEPQRTLGQAPS